MKYKVGDKVKIKTWGEMEKKYGRNSCGSINCKNAFTKKMEEEIEKLNCNRILTIDSVYAYFYGIKEMSSWNWSEDMIKCLVKEDKDSEPITSRFDILDIR